MGRQKIQMCVTWMWRWSIPRSLNHQRRRAWTHLVREILSLTLLIEFTAHKKKKLWHKLSRCASPRSHHRARKPLELSGIQSCEHGMVSTTKDRGLHVSIVQKNLARQSK